MVELRNEATVSGGVGAWEAAWFAACRRAADHTPKQIRYSRYQSVGNAHFSTKFTISNASLTLQNIYWTIKDALLIDFMLWIYVWVYMVLLFVLCTCVCVCVYVRKRGREKEEESVEWVVFGMFNFPSKCNEKELLKQKHEWNLKYNTHLCIIRKLK